jgi:hypothetical protein
MPSRIEIKVINVPLELRRRFKALCTLRGITMSNAIIMMMAKEVAQADRTGRHAQTNDSYADT